MWRARHRQSAPWVRIKVGASIWRGELSSLITTVPLFSDGVTLRISGGWSVSSFCSLRIRLLVKNVYQMFFGQKLPPNLLVVPGEVARQATELCWVKSKLWVKPEKQKKMLRSVGFLTLGSSAVGRSPALWWWHRPGGGEGSALLQNSDWWFESKWQCDWSLAQVIKGWEVEGQYF